MAVAKRTPKDPLSYGIATRVPKSHYDQAYSEYLKAHKAKYGTEKEPRLKAGYKAPFGKEEFFRKIKSGSVIIVGKFLFHRYAMTTWRVQI